MRRLHSWANGSRTFGPKRGSRPAPALTTTMGEHRMAKLPLPTPDELRQLLDYDQETGALKWRERGPELFAGRGSSAETCARRWNGNYAGRPAGSHKASGYITVGVWGTDIGAHRVAWAISHDEWPPEDIDHINGDRADNRLANLRSVSRALNMRNQRFRVRASTGVVGVSKTPDGTYRAAIGWGESYQYLGTFPTLAEAAAVRKKAEHQFEYHQDHGSERSTV